MLKFNCEYIRKILQVCDSDGIPRFRDERDIVNKALDKIGKQKYLKNDIYNYTYDGKAESLSSENDSQNRKRLAEALEDRGSESKSFKDVERLHILAVGLSRLNNEYNDHFLPGCDKYTTEVEIADYLENGYYMDYLPQDWDLKNKENCFKYLFGGNVDSPKSEFKHLVREWQNFPWNSLSEYPGEELQIIAQEIVAASNRHPLYCYLYDRERIKENWLETRILLQHSVTFSRDNEGKRLIIVRPPVGAVLRWIHESVRDTMCPQRIYSEMDFLQMIGELAREITDEGTHHITCENFGQLEEKYSAVCGIEDIISDIKNSDPPTAGHIQWTVPQINDGRKFKIRLYRLAFAGIGVAMEANRSSAETGIIVNSLYQNILQNIPYTEKDHVHIDDEYDDIVMYASAVILSLDEKLADLLIGRLCEGANNFSVAERDKQISLIYILSYLLTENITVKAELRERMFKAAYGQTIYKLEAMEIPQLFSTSRFYEEHIAKTIKEACSFTEDGKKTCGQPEYLFLFGEISPECHRKYGFDDASSEFLIKASKIRSTTWYGEKNNKKNDVGISLSENEIKKAHDVLLNSDSKKEDLIRYSYALQMIGYSYANCINMQPEECSDFTKALLTTLNSCSNHFFHALFAADFYCRVYNPFYSMEDTGNPAMYLLCGCTRAIACAENIKSISLDKVYTGESGNALEIYRDFFDNEKSRYKFLLGRLVLHLKRIEEHTDFRDDVFLSLAGDVASRDIPEFMPYDNIDPVRLIELRNDKEGFLQYLKNGDRG